ncbi:MAG: hypothetical protein JKY30_02635 [Flavobacteriales bacterium]|nr:hypothetical protein [Flavobacteriales bacterium]
MEKTVSYLFSKMFQGGKTTSYNEKTIVVGASLTFLLLIAIIMMMNN